MTAHEALSIAEAKRSAHEVPGSARGNPGARCWIELGQRQPDGRYLVRDELVWVVRFSLPGAWIDLAISETSRDVVRVEKSRGYVLRHERLKDEE